MPSVNGIDRFEALAEQIVEGTFGKLFRSPLHPSEVMRRLARAMEDGAAEEDGHTAFPNRYDVWLSPVDLEELTARGVRSPEQEIERWLWFLAQELSGEFVGPLSVSLRPKAGLRSGEIEVTAVRTGAEGPSADTREMAVSIAGQCEAEGWCLVSAGGTWQLGRLLVRVGRALENDVILEDPSVSRFHLELHWRDGGYSLMDRDSTNGTLLNGRILEPGEEIRLQAGDGILAGKLRLKFDRCA
jgi:hypothetical protein